MLEIRCPKCDGEIKGLAGDYISWRSDRRRCPSCGTELALSNSFICYGLCALIFGGLFTGLMLRFAGRGLMWLGLIGVIIVLWLMLPVVVRLLGRWHVVDDAISYRVKRWSMVVKVSRIVLFAAVAVTFISFGLQYKDLLEQARDMDSRSYSAEGFFCLFKFGTIVSFVVAAVAFVTHSFALLMRRSAFAAQKQRDLIEEGRAGGQIR